MNSEIKTLINQAVIKIIQNTATSAKIKKIQDKHTDKIHFIPKRYRVFGDLLQSMNIQFRNFIEILMALLIKNDGRYDIIQEFSGKKSNSFNISKTNEARIDAYITHCQTSSSTNLDMDFKQLQNDIIVDNDDKLSKFKHDIDLLFQDKTTKRYFYLEIKYNDDHDTGKFVDINRKFIKTFTYLVKELNITNIENLTPILFFFNNKKMKGNIYVPEKTNIRRGEAFFNEFLNIPYSELDKYLLTLSEEQNNIKKFRDLCDKITL